MVKIFNKILHKKGVLNIGGRAQSVYNFVKKYNPNIRKIYAKNNKKIKIPINSSMNISKLTKFLKKKRNKYLKQQV